MKTSHTKSSKPSSDSNTLLLTKALVSCPSITPIDAGCQKLIIERLSNLGFQIVSLPFGEVQNFWATYGDKKPLFAFAGHTDVVPPGPLEHWFRPPFTPYVENGLLYGRGSADMKGSLAAMVTATERFLKNHPTPKGSLAFLITSDEEGPAQNGTKKVIEYLSAQGIKIDYCIVGEPSSNTQLGDVIKQGRRGSLSGTLTILGKQGHIAYPHRAKNPIHHALPVLQALVNTSFGNKTEHFQATSFQISNIQAGTGATNVIPAHLECQFNFRFGVSSTSESLQAKVVQLLEDHNVDYTLTWVLHGNPFLTPGGKLLSACRDAVFETQHITPLFSTEGGTSDARFIAPMGTEVLELGPINDSIHSINEHVKVEDLDKLSSLYERILEKMLG